MNFGIIGAGPSGIIAALRIKQLNNSHEVFLFDGNQKIGRKLFATGNGRCNITNMNAGRDSYYSCRPQNLSPVFEQYGPKEIREILFSLGIPTVETDDGWVYPASWSAANVVQILSDDLTCTGVHVYPGCRVTKIIPENDSFRLTTEGINRLPVFDRILICGGSKAFPQLGANTSILSELFQFGHRDLPFIPALAPITAKGQIFKELQGQRMDCEVTLLEGEKAVDKAFGNLIFTDYGLNGPGVMNISHRIEAEKAGKYSLKIDFIPGEAQKLINDAFYAHINQPYLYRSVFLTVLPMKLVEYFFKLWKLDWETNCKQIDSRTFRVHLKRLQSGIIPIEGSRGYNFGQTAAGGIPLNEVDLNTMESVKKSGLFFAGEVLDVTGPCGGYNLTWAWATGLIAGDHMAM